MCTLGSIFRKLSIIVLAAFFVAAGVAHFVNPEFFTRIMPPYLPAPLELVYLSGVFEILGGVGILVRRLRRAAGWGLIALLFAVFPANIHMALNPEQFSEMPRWGLLARLPLQFVLMAWIYLSTIRRFRRPCQGSASRQSVGVVSTHVS